MNFIFAVMSKDSFPNLSSQCFFSSYFSKNFIILHLSIKSMIHFELIFVYHIRFYIKVYLFIWAKDVYLIAET